MRAENASFVIFDDGAKVPISEAWDHSDASQYGYAWPKSIVWDDGSESYAKGWIGNHDAGYKQKLVTIGAGSYGDMTILRRAPERNDGAR